MLPWKIKSLAFFARRYLEDAFPRTKPMESPIFDFPQPFGPVITAKFEGKTMLVGLLNDLNPCITIFSNLTIHIAFTTHVNMICCDVVTDYVELPPQ